VNDAGPAQPSPSPTGERGVVRAVAIPSEHGGWGLTIEPALLGLLVAPSGAGAALGLAAFVTFLARTPVKIWLVDRTRHHHRLERTRVAGWIAISEAVIIVGLVALASLTASGAFWIPLVIASPLVAVQLGFDARSRSRRLLPELAGAIAISAVVGAIVLAGGGAGTLAAALWLIVAARVIASIPFVRLHVWRLHGRSARPATALAAQVIAVATAAVAAVLDRQVLAGTGTIVAVAVYQAVAVRRKPWSARALGIEQTIVGVTVVIVTALGVAVA